MVFSYIGNFDNRDLTKDKESLKRGTTIREDFRDLRRILLRVSTSIQNLREVVSQRNYIYEVEYKRLIKVNLQYIGEDLESISNLINIVIIKLQNSPDIMNKKVFEEPLYKALHMIINLIKETETIENYINRDQSDSALLDTYIDNAIRTITKVWSIVVNEIYDYF